MRESPATSKRFCEAFDAHFDAITRYCFRRLPANQANDAAASVFVVAWRKIEQMPGGDGTLPWLYGVARREVSTFRRSARRASALGEKLARQPRYPAPGPDTVVVRNLEQADLLRALATLAPGDQEILRLRAYEELSLAQIAVVLGCSHDAAKKRSARALKRLRRAAGFPERPEAPTGSRAIQEGGDA